MRYYFFAVLFSTNLFIPEGFGQTRFTDVTAASGIKQVFKVYEGMFGGGACVFDYNNDGYEDVFIIGARHSLRYIFFSKY